MTKCRLAIIFALGLLVAPASAGQITPEASKGGDAAKRGDAAKAPGAQDVAKAAFLAMSEADRKAVQEALGWLGFYNGTVDGSFGKRSIDSLVAYQRTVDAPGDGVVMTKQLGDLKEAARKAKAAVGFQVFDDVASGVRIGAPMKLLDKRDLSPGAARLASKDGMVTLDLVQESAALSDLYKRATGDVPGRKITYKATKPGTFFVVAGEEAGAKFYRRVAKAPADAPDPTITRGFTFTYPIERAKTLDPLALAIANAFDPFPTTPLPIAGKPIVAIPAPAAGPKLTATALVIGKGQAVTFLSAADCAEPTIGGKPARFAPGATEGLVRLDGDFAGAAPALSASEGDGDLMVLSFAPAGAGKAVLVVADAQALADAHILASLDASARGAPVLDRRGALAGLVSPLKGALGYRGGVALSAPHALAASATLGDLLPIGPARPSETLGAAEVAKRMRNSLVAVFCGA